MNNPSLSKRTSMTAPDNMTALLVLSDGTLFWGKGVGAQGASVGEICFNTSMTGYQEILTDPSYAGQIITFTFPHIGNVGTNDQDIECDKPRARGLILRTDITDPSNWRSIEPFNAWLVKNNLIGITGIDTRALTSHIRDKGAPNGVIAYAEDGQFDLDDLLNRAKSWPGLEGMDLAREVSCTHVYEWNEPLWQRTIPTQRFHVVAIDYGAKKNILRCLVSAGCRVTVVPSTITSEEIFSLCPDGVFLSNGPGDPAATGLYAVSTIRAILERRIPLFGICLGHQLLALTIGAKTAKMKLGHRGANQPVKDLQTGKIEITSQNHGFEVLTETLPTSAEVTHVSLFDGSNEGVRLKDQAAFSVQYHPEASPGPHDSHYLFKRFIDMIEADKASRKAA